MSYFPNAGFAGVVPALTRGRRGFGGRFSRGRRFNPGGYASGRGAGRNFRIPLKMGHRTGYRVGYRNIGSAGSSIGGVSLGKIRAYDRLPSYRQHPVSGAIAASIMNDHRDVAFHVRQSFKAGLRARRGGFRRFGRSRYSRFSRRRRGGF